VGSVAKGLWLSLRLSAGFRFSDGVVASSSKLQDRVATTATNFVQLGFSSNRQSRLPGSLVAQSFNRVTDKKSGSTGIY